MKIIKTFTDLAEAIAYITLINEAFEKEIEAGKAQASEIKALKVAADADKKALALEIKDLTAAAATDKKALAEAINEMSVLGEKLALTEKHGNEGLIVSVGRKSYTLIGDTFIYGGSAKTAEELRKDKKELARMVELGSGALVEIN